MAKYELGGDLGLSGGVGVLGVGVAREGGKMSGARLCTTLAHLGFEGWQLLDPDSFEWPFQYEETRPLLDFLCTNLRPSNVLSLPELLQ